MRNEEEAIFLAKAILILDKYGFIQTYDEDSESQCAHLREMALRSANNILQLSKSGKGND